MDFANFRDDFSERLVKLQFGDKQRARVYRKMASFLRNGVSLPDTLRTLHRFATNDGRKPKAPTAIVLKTWLDRVSDGKSLGRAVQGWRLNNLSAGGGFLWQLWRWFCLRRARGNRLARRNFWRQWHRGWCGPRRLGDDIFFNNNTVSRLTR